MVNIDLPSNHSSCKRACVLYLLYAASHVDDLDDAINVYFPNDCIILSKLSTGSDVRLHEVR